MKPTSPAQFSQWNYENPIIYLQQVATGSGSQEFVAGAGGATTANRTLKTDATDGVDALFAEPYTGWSCSLVRNQTDLK